MRTHLPVAALILGLSTPATAQDDIPRTPSGRPDLSGTYDIATRTPMMRDPKYGDGPYMSAEDAHGIAASTEAAKVQADIPSDPDREAPPVGGDGHRSNIGGHNPFWFDFGTIPFQVDGKYRNSITGIGARQTQRFNECGFSHAGRTGKTNPQCLTRRIGDALQKRVRQRAVVRAAALNKRDGAC